MEYADTIMHKKGLFDRLMGRSGSGGSGVVAVAANQTIAVYGTQGGVGASCLTALLSKTLHQWGFTVSVVEAAASGGSFLRLMGKRPVNQGLDTMSRNREKLQGEMESIRVNIIKGLNVYPRSGALHNAQWTWNEEEAMEFLGMVRKMAGTGFMLIDVGNIPNDALSRAALTKADHIVTVFRPTDMGIDAAARFGDRCHYGGLNKKLIWLANQVESKHSLAKAGEIIGQRVDYCISWEKDMGHVEQGDKPPQHVQDVVEELLRDLIRAPSAKVF